MLVLAALCLVLAPFVSVAHAARLERGGVRVCAGRWSWGCSCWPWDCWSARSDPQPLPWSASERRS